MITKFCEHFANMLAYGIDFSQQVHENRGKLMTRTGVQAAGIGAVGGFVAGGSIVLAPFTFGLSLIPGAVGTAAAVVGINENCENNGPLNNNKTSICLENEIRNTDNRLGKKSDCETERYENKYLQEAPRKENCRIM